MAKASQTRTTENRPFSSLRTITNAALALTFGRGKLSPAANEHEIATLKRERLPATDTPEGVGHLSYMRAGTAGGDRVIFLHGTPGNAVSWADFLLAPEPGYEYFALDRPGFGESDPAPITDLATQAAAAAALFPKNSKKKALLVGHSYGVGVAIRAAMDYPQRISGLLLSGSPLDPNLETTLLIQKLATRISRLLPTEIANSNAELLDYRQELLAVRNGLGWLQHPMTFIHGTRDIEVPFENMNYIQRMCTANPQARYKVLIDYPHYLPWMALEHLQEALRSLMQRV